MKVLVTGAGGFIASHLVEELLENGHEVKALVRYSSHSSIGNLVFVDRSRWGSRLELVFGDVRDASHLLAISKNVQATVHLAALIGIPYSYSAPQSYLDTNTQGTLNILEVARQLALDRVVVTSTSEVYGSALYTPIDESHPLQAQSPYSASKIAADKIAESFAHSFDLPVVILRPFNTYGPRQSARAVLPTIIAQLLSTRSEIALGSTTPKRDLVFVKDTARALRLALETDDALQQTIHVGTGKAISIGQLATLCMEISGIRKTVVQRPERIRPVNSEVDLLLADARKATELLGWNSTVQLAEGVQAVIDFIKEHPELYEPDLYRT